MNKERDLVSAVQHTSTLPYLQFASILLSGLERLADIQKSALSIYADAGKRSAEVLRPALPVPLAPLFEMAEQAIREFLQIQVRLLDLMMSQTSEKREAVQNGSDQGFEGEVAKLMLDSTDCLLGMQKKAVEFIIQQNQSFAAEIAKPGGGIPEGSQMPTDSSAIIQAQKKFWEATLKPFKAWQAEATSIPGQ